jgi:hypothetical protein
MEDSEFIIWIRSYIKDKETLDELDVIEIKQNLRRMNLDFILGEDNLPENQNISGPVPTFSKYGNS